MVDQNIPEVTLMIASSVDGCLVSGESFETDKNKSWKQSDEIRGLLYQFFDFSRDDTVYNLSTSRLLVQIGINNPRFKPKKEPIQMIVLDHWQLLTPIGIKNLSASVSKLVVITSDQSIEKDTSIPSSVAFVHADAELNLKAILQTLAKKHKIEKVTIQSAGTMNSQWLESGVVDFLIVVIYPLLVGNNGTPVFSTKELITVRPLRLLSSNVFDTHYLSLQYRVLNESQDDRNRKK